jgi:hypothetical protein
MDVRIMGINFNYEQNTDGTSGISDVNLSFSTSGGTYSMSGFIKVSLAVFNSAAGDFTQYENLVKQQIIADLTAPAAPAQ